MTATETRIDFDPQVGDRVHVCFYTDVKPATVIKRTAKFVTVRLDQAKLADDWKPEILPGGFAGHCTNNRQQQWEITEDPDGCTIRFSDRGFKYSHWNALTGETFRRIWRECGGTCHLGDGWRRFHDYNF